MTYWQWQSSGPLVATAITLIILQITLCWRLLKLLPKKQRKRQLPLEILRTLCVTVLALVLLKPEIVREIPVQDKPDLVILEDHSTSMATEDIRTTDRVISRRAWVEANLPPAFWQPLESTHTLVHQTFPQLAENDVTNLHAALSATMEQGHPQAIVLISDGDWNAGPSPVLAATSLDMQHIPVITIPTGAPQYLPDLVLTDVRAPTFGLLNEHISIPYRVLNRFQHDVETQLEVRVNGRVIQTHRLVIPGQSQIQDTLLWPALKTGDYAFDLALDEIDNELTDANNRFSFNLTVRQESLKALVIESLPRWEYRYLRNALSRDPGVDVDCLLFHPGLPTGEGPDYIRAFPLTAESLAQYDVIFLGDVGLNDKELTEDNVEAIHHATTQLGTGLVFLPGRRGRILSLLPTPLGDLLPVTLKANEPQGNNTGRENALQLTVAGEDHLLTMLATSATRNRQVWQQLPGFFWHAAVEKAKPGSTVLAVHQSLRNEWGRVPLLTTRPGGLGQVLFMGTDSAWRWRKGVEDTYHYRFWGQVIRWMAHPRHLAQSDGVRLLYSPERPSLGDTISLNALLAELPGASESEERERLTLSIKRPDDQDDILLLHPVPNAWGVYTGSYKPALAGSHQITLKTSAARVLETTIEVLSAQTEKVGEPANIAIMQQISRMTGGQALSTQELDQLPAILQALPTPKPMTIRLPLWSQWWVGALLLGLLTIYWIWRKALGLA